MARLLVFDIDVTHPEQIKDREACFKRGDVVWIAEDGHEFSAAERQHPFRIIDLPGPAADYEYLREGEPRTLKEDYPPSLVAVRRLHGAMRRRLGTRGRRHRQWQVSAQGVITRKPAGVG